MNSQDGLGYVFLQAKYCLCNDVDHFFLSNPVIKFRCCCPETIPAGNFAMEILVKPFTIPSSPKERDICNSPPIIISEIGDLLEEPSQNCASISSRSPPVSPFMISDFDMGLLEESSITGRDDDMDGNTEDTKTFVYPNVNQVEATSDHQLFHFDESEDVSVMDVIDESVAISSEPEDEIPNELLSLGQETSLGILMSIMDYVFREIPSSVLDEMLEEVVVSFDSDIPPVTPRFTCAQHQHEDFFHSG